MMDGGITITVIIPSRDRPRGLAAILTSLDTLASGKHKIQYGVCRDDDDGKTGIMCNWIGNDIPLHVRIDGRPESLGGMVNEMAEKMPADVYTSLADDIICITKDWDDKIAEAFKKTPHGVFWWKDVSPADAYYAIITEKWRVAAGRMFTSDYPYWFDDLCLMELWLMTTLAEPIQILDLNIADKGRNTMRMRELPFWQKFFTFTRAHRVQEGIEIAAKLGLPKPEGGQHIEDRLNQLVKAVPKEWLEQIERDQGEATEPDDSYKKTKARAMQIMGM